MISIISEITDAKGSNASRGWVFFDRDCPVCVSLARRVRPTLQARGFGLAALQDPRVQALLALSEDQLLLEMRVATGDGKVYGGAEAIVFLARQIWWSWPLYSASKLPGVPQVLDAAYRWFARHRTCAGRSCCSIPIGSPNELTNQEHGEHQ